MKPYRRIFVIVLDSLGIGAMPDAKDYGDANTNTFAHIWNTQHGLHIPNLLSLGLGKLTQIEESQHTKGCCLRLFESSNGKDTMTGHWEMMGIYTQTPFQTFTEHGFPKDLIRELEKRFGKAIIGNKSASGTQILDELAEEEIYHNKVIVYTSADSVLQIPGNEETMGLDTLYHYCEIARELTLQDKWKVGRVIARPYTGKHKGEFVRTSNRKDYALKPPSPTVMNLLKDSGYDVIGIGKIKDIFAGEGLTEALHSNSSVHGMEQTIELTNRDFHGLCFTNLVDFDALWGHRRNPEGYGKELEKFDKNLSVFLKNLKDEDLLLITADNGNDPTHTGTDHTREMVPLLAYSPSMAEHSTLNDQKSFAVIGATIAQNFGINMPDNLIGTSILNQIRI